MMLQYEVYQLALNVPVGSSAGQVAFEVCYIRGVDPYQWMQAPVGGLPAWQMVIYEALLLRALSEPQVLSG